MIKAKTGDCLPPTYFRYRILIVDDDILIQRICRHLLQAQGFEVLSAHDGFEGLTALKYSMPDMIISDLEMPNMSGFEFLSVVRRRFPAIPVIVISGAFSGLLLPKNIFADAFLVKGAYVPGDLLAKINKLLQELPDRPKGVKSTQAAVWMRNDKGIVVVTCPQCLRAFPVLGLSTGMNEAACHFCSSLLSFEVVTDANLLSPIDCWAGAYGRMRLTTPYP